MEPGLRAVSPRSAHPAKNGARRAGTNVWVNPPGIAPPVPPLPGREIAAKIFKQPAVGAGRRGEAVGKTWNLVSVPSRPVPPTPPKTGRDGREQTFG
ncbi:MAG: hypothetical protein HS099_00975 [Ardenticatenaceae bacterium]|nr:hypothetical protein [Ardenticatenaceae bacterium]